MRAYHKLRILTLILRDALKLKLKTESESEKILILKYRDLRISSSIKLKRFLSTISLLKMICNKTNLMSKIEILIVITNLMLCCFDIKIVINDSKLNEIIVDLRFFYMRK